MSTIEIRSWFFLRKTIKIGDLCKKLNLSYEVVVQTLLNAGFNILRNDRNQLLNRKQVEVISKYYIKAIRAFHKQSKAKIKQKELSYWEDYELKRFFQRFAITRSHYVSQEYIYNYVFAPTYFEDISIEDIELDDSLIEGFFYQIISSEDTRHGYWFNYILSKIRFRICKIFKDGRTNIFSIIPFKQYHIFSDEEDHSRLASILSCFSNVTYMLREAINKTLIYLSFSNEKYQITYTTYTRVRPV